MGGSTTLRPLLLGSKVILTFLEVVLECLRLFAPVHVTLPCTPLYYRISYVLYPIREYTPFTKGVTPFRNRILFHPPQAIRELFLYTKLVPIVVKSILS
jgi:hypothetical protein